MRITTRAIIRNYNTGLNRAGVTLNAQRMKVLTKRNFNEMSEDPGGAVQAFQLRGEFRSTQDYLDNVSNAQSHLDSVESSVMQINTMAKQVKVDVLTACNDTTSKQQRHVLATNLREIQESMVLSANAQFGDKFIFGGASTKEVPFVLSDDGKTLTYRGIDVNTSDPAQLAELEALSKENLYIDIGFGLKEDASGKLISSSAFDMATPGINVLKYGVDEDGKSNNMICLIGDMIDELESSSYNRDRFNELAGKFDNSHSELIDTITQYGTKSNFLEHAKSNLQDRQDLLNEKIVALEDVNLADAISNYKWAEFAYNAALKVGSSVLSPSFIDFMK